MTFAREEYSDELRSEILPLIQSHYEEVEQFQDIPLDPNWETYAKLEKIGYLRIYTIRDKGRLCGYCIFIVSNNPHYKNSIQSSQDVLFLSEDCRKGTEAWKFIKWCDGKLKEDGVQVAYHHVKKVRDFGPILERMGYEMIEKIYARRLDKEG